jgi:hypothetical protein
MGLHLLGDPRLSVLYVFFHLFLTSELFVTSQFSLPCPFRDLSWNFVSFYSSLMEKVTTGT